MFASGTLGGAGFGAVLGALGESMSSNARTVVGTAVGLILLVTAARPFPMPQVNRETSQKILERGPIQWAAINGGLLGIAITSRIGFWLWYAVPTYAVTSGNWRSGAAAYGVYAVARMAAIVALSARIRSPGDSQRVMERMLGLRATARTVCRWAAVAVGLTYVAILGL